MNRIIEARFEGFMDIESIRQRVIVRPESVVDLEALLNRPWFPRHSPSSGNSVSHTLLETAA